MAFSSNPLSLNVPDHAFESWLRDSGYLDIIDHRQSVAPTADDTSQTAEATSTSSLTGLIYGLSVSLFYRLWISVSLFTVNPFAKLTGEDISRETPSWTYMFLGDFGSYSFPAAVSQAKLRIQENVKRYARNYAWLFILTFACSLYQMPLALVGLILSLAIWDAFMFCSHRWSWDRYPLLKQVLIRTAQCATAVILIYLNVQMALLCAIMISYTVMILHAGFRKLTPVKQPYGDGLRWKVLFCPEDYIYRQRDGVHATVQ